MRRAGQGVRMSKWMMAGYVLAGLIGATVFLKLVAQEIALGLRAIEVQLEIEKERKAKEAKAREEEEEGEMTEAVTLSSAG